MTYKQTRIILLLFIIVIVIIAAQVDEGLTISRTISRHGGDTILSIAMIIITIKILDTEVYLSHSGGVILVLSHLILTHLKCVNIIFFFTLLQRTLEITYQIIFQFTPPYIHIIINVYWFNNNVCIKI